MPEGPSIVILKEEVQQFKGKKILEVNGNSRIGIERLTGQKITDFKSWGKHFLICFKGFSLRVHFLLFGSYRVDEQRDRPPRLSLKFKNGELNFYSCSIRFIEEELDSVYEWDTDVMSDLWDPGKAKKKIRKLKNTMVCDVLLDQHIFAGSGNIIKNEVLYRIRVHPGTFTEDLPLKKLNELIAEARNYSFDFYH